MIELDITVDGQRHEVRLEPSGSGWLAHVDGATFPVQWHRRGTQAAVSVADHVHVIDLMDAHTADIDGQPVPFRIGALAGVAGAPADEGGGHGPVRPPMTGRLEALLVEEGQDVEKGQVLFVLEAMKMRNEVKAPAAGRVHNIRAKAGDAVEPAAVILDLVPSSSD